MRRDFSKMCISSFHENKSLFWIEVSKMFSSFSFARSIYLFLWIQLWPQGFRSQLFVMSALLNLQGSREDLNLMFSEHTRSVCLSLSHSQRVRLLFLGNITSRRWADSVKAFLSDCGRVFCRMLMESCITEQRHLLAPWGHQQQLNSWAAAICGVNRPLVCGDRKSVV